MMLGVHLAMAFGIAAISMCDIFVAPNGSDTASGASARSPLLTLQAARDARRRLGPGGTVTVCLAQGHYAQLSPLRLSAADGDSGTNWIGAAGRRMIYFQIYSGFLYVWLYVNMTQE